jgi:hypothetical protein
MHCSLGELQLHNYFHDLEKLKFFSSFISLKDQSFVKESGGFEMLWNNLLLKWELWI